MIPERFRAYIYRVLLGAQPITTFYGLVEEKEAVLWMGLAATVLSLGLATVNTSTKTPPGS